MRELNRDGEWEDSEEPRRRMRPLEDVVAVANFQRVIIFCVLLRIVSYGAAYLVPDKPLWLVLAGHLLLATVEAVFLFLLSLKVFNVGWGIVMAFLAFIPCVGLIALLVINGRATATLREAGVSVGLMGASGRSLDKLRRRRAAMEERRYADEYEDDE